MEDEVGRMVVHDIYSDWEAHAKSCGRCILALRGGVGIGFGMSTVAEPCDEGRELLGEARFAIIDAVDRGSLHKRWMKGLPPVTREQLDHWRKARDLRTAQLVAATDLANARLRAFLRRRHLVGNGPAGAGGLRLELGDRVLANCDDAEAWTVLVAREYISSVHRDSQREQEILKAMTYEVPNQLSPR